MQKTAPVLAHTFQFDPTYGYDLERLLTVPAPEGPDDFAEFWRRTYEEARAVPLEIAHREVESGDADFALHEVEFTALDGVRIGGWITVPRGYDGRDATAGGWVVGPGYGGREGADYDLPRPLAPAIFPCARGFHRSAHEVIPFGAAKHVLHGIESRETYVHRGCVADLWGAASVLAELFPETAGNLRYFGGSFGGGIGALALPWDERFRAGYLNIPSFGNHPLRVQLPCVGSGAFVRQRYRKQPEVLDVLAYFDAATAAREIRIPVFVAAALFDPAVPPPGQFAVYNALAGPKELYVRTAAHFDSPYEAPESAEIRERLGEFFTR